MKIWCLIAMVACLVCSSGCDRKSQDAPEAASSLESRADDAADLSREIRYVSSKASFGDADYPILVDALNINRPENTTLAVSTRWQEASGKRVQWTAKVFDVKGGRGRATIYAVRQEKPSYRGYNIVLTTHDLIKAGRLHKDDPFEFRGSLVRYTNRQGSPVVMYVDNGEILSE